MIIYECTVLIEISLKGKYTVFDTKIIVFMSFWIRAHYVDVNVSAILYVSLEYFLFTDLIGDLIQKKLNLSFQHFGY